MFYESTIAGRGWCEAAARWAAVFMTEGRMYTYDAMITRSNPFLHDIPLRLFHL